MKILRISLKNLNSLRGEHAIDLEAEPLASAGIFAITGPTGAGKSTLLDAITLALFGRSARYGTTPNPEDVMSRHTGDCRAEVTFEIPQGRFRAAWHLNRARGLAEGKLQPAKRFIYDAHGATLAQNIKQADEKIVELTGLDYDRFLRSVLLAQGEFARFLKARADERSELLEQLTGTVIYSQLGILAHEEKARREHDFEVREQALGSIELLSDEVRNTSLAEINEHNDRLASIALERVQLVVAIQRGRSLAESETKLAALKERHERLDAQMEQHRPEFDALALHRRAEPFVIDLARLDQLDQDHARLAPLVEAAEGARLAAMDHLAEVFSAAIAVVGELLSQKHAAMDQCVADFTSAEREAAEIDQWLAGHAADTALQASLPELSAIITTLTHLRGEKAALGNKDEDLKAQLANAEQRVVQRQADTQTAKERLSVLDQALLKAQEEQLNDLAGRTIASLETSLADAQAEQQRLQDSKALLKQRDELTEKTHALAKDLVARQQPLEQLAAEHASLTTLVRQGSDLASALHESFRKSQLIAKLEEHRASLTHGEACPLCGGLDHPFADDVVEPASEITRLKSELETASAELQKHQLQRDSKAYELARAEQSMIELQKRRDEEQAALQQLETALAEAPKELQTMDGVHIAISQVQRRIVKVENALKSARAHVSAVAAADKECVAQRHAADTARLHEQTAKDDLARIQHSIEANAEVSQNNLASLQDTEHALAQPLAVLALDVPAEGEEKALSQVLIQRRDHAVARQQELQRLRSTSQQIGARQEQLQREADELQRQAKDFIRAQSESLPEASDPREAAALRWPTPQLAQAAIDEAKTAVTSASATLGERQTAAEQARTALASAGQALSQRLQESEFAGIDALRAALLPALEAQRIATLQKTVTDEELQLASLWQSAQADADVLRAQQPPQGEALAAAEQALHDLDNDKQTRSNRIAVLKSGLERDDENRARQLAGREQIERERGLLVVWRQLADLIGSHDGKKFRVFAQGLSLDLLIRHANRHLQRLAERYRLRRRLGEALELEIIDLHQASVARPMASLSGGESFLASLALALGLSDLAGRNVRIDSLFIDEGFGSLDADSLDVAVAALESLRLNQKTVGIISHVDLLKERITTQVQVERGAGGISSIAVKA